jgi:hypothetical protein
MCRGRFLFFASGTSSRIGRFPFAIVGMTAFPAPETFFPLEISQKFETGLFVGEPLPDVDG